MIPARTLSTLIYSGVRQFYDGFSLTRSPAWLAWGRALVARWVWSSWCAACTGCSTRQTGADSSAQTLWTSSWRPRSCMSRSRWAGTRCSDTSEGNSASVRIAARAASRSRSAGARRLRRVGRSRISSLGRSHCKGRTPLWLVWTSIEWPASWWCRPARRDLRGQSPARNLRNPGQRTVVRIRVARGTHRALERLRTVADLLLRRTLWTRGPTGACCTNTNP